MHGVDDWSYGFNSSTPRTLCIRINGFVSVPIASDPTFEIEIGLQFSARWSTTSFVYPAEKKFVATLVDSRIKVNGIASEYIAEDINEAMISAFTPGPADPEITDHSMVLATVSTGANHNPGSENLDVLDVMLTADGTLNVYVNPLPAIDGAFRRLIAQRALDAALENL